MPPWKVLATVFAITAFGLFSLWGAIITGNEAFFVLAGGAGGALFGYLGKVNGATSSIPE